MSSPIIVIDPGHYPGTPNKGPTGYYEYQGVWTIANYLKPALEQRGCQVSFTKATIDENPSLTVRGQKAKGADLFISEHTNAANQAARGVEVYYSVQVPGDKVLAANLSKAVSALMKNPDRGAKTRQSTKSATSDYYTVMASARRTGCPHVILIESGFHDNALDEAFLKSSANLKAIAETQAEVICAFLGVSGPSSPLPEEDLTPIMGKSVATAGQMSAYIKKINPKIAQSVIDMISSYLKEGDAEGVRGDIAFAQSCLETGNFIFSNSAVTLAQNNFCGMGVTANGMTGASFPDPATGIRAQIDHLKAYASLDPLKVTPSPDPRFSLVKRGSAPYLEWLGAKENPNGAGWATGAGYGTKILKILNDILKCADETPEPKPVVTNDPSGWAKEAWDWAVSNKITDGTDPQGTPTREQAVQLLYNLWKIVKDNPSSQDNPGGNTTPAPVDKPSDWAKEAWDWAVANKITDGTNPQGTPTREQVVQLLYNLKKIL